MKRAITTISVVGGVGAAYAVFAATMHLAVASPRLMASVHVAVLSVLSAGFLAACGWAFVLRVEAGQRRVVADCSTVNDARMTRIESELMAAAARADRRFEILRSALVSLGAELADNTGELRRAVGAATPAVPAIDPATLKLMRELDQNGFPGSGGHHSP